MKKLLLFAFVLMSVVNVFAGGKDGKPAVAMSGIYTVNPAAAVSSTNFIRIGQADTAMMNNGISGPVEIQIYNGTYNQTNMNLGVVPGSDPTNTITFTSFSQDSVQTIISSPFNFYGTSNIIIKKLNLFNVVIDGNVSNYTITNNQIKLFSWLGGNNVSFINNYIKPLADFNNLTNYPPAISFASKSGAFISNVIVDNNIFRQATYYNQAGVGTTGYSSTISWTKVSKPTLRNNRFQNINAINVGYGLIGCCTYTTYAYGSTFQFDRCTDTAFIERNRFDSISTDRFVHDIDATNQNNTSARLSSIVIRNNFFSVTGQLGMIPYAQGACNIEFYYNNINSRLNGSGVVLSTNMINIKNNIFASTDGSRVITYAAHPAVADYNDFYTTGPVLVTNTSPTTVNYATLAQYKAATGLNTNSITVNPKYIDVSNLHVLHPGLLAKGTPHPPVNPVITDIDNDNRNTLNPCIGADEFQVPSNDVIALQYIGPKKDFTASAPTPLSLKILNYGSAQLNAVNVRWSVNGVEQTPPYSWTGSLDYDSTATIQFGSYVFDMMKYNSLKIWTDLPNNAPDMVPANDTLRIDSIMPYARGTFTLGGATPQLPNFAKANEYLVYGGVDGAVDIAIRNGKYTEQPIMKFSRGAGIVNTITFRGENNDASLDSLSFSSITNGATPYFTMRLDSAAYYRFKNITFQSLSASSREVEFSRKTRFITFDSCMFTSASTSANLAHIEGNTISSLPQLDSNVVFTNNKFTGGYGGITLPLRNGLIKGNRFENFLSGNSSFGTLNFTGSFAPLNNTIVIDSNYFSNPVVCTFSSGGICYITGYNAMAGIQLNSTSAENDFTVSRNRMNVIFRNAIDLRCSGTAAKPIRIFNNMITIRGSGSAVTSATNANYVEIMHNSFADSLNSGSNLVEIRGTNTTMKNNVLVKGVPNITSTSAANLLNIASASIATFTATNNAYAINDSTKAINNGATNLTLGQWKATGKDAASSPTTPAFINIAADLHIDKNKSGSVDLAKKATPIAYIIKDIDDSTRSIGTPCIGADEFTLNAVDGGVMAINAPVAPMTAGNNPVIVSIRNFGETTISSATVNWTVNNAPQTAFNFSGSIASGDSAININLGSFNFNQLQGYTIKTWTSNVNGGGDINQLNDTIIKTVYPALCGSYTVGGTTPDFITPKTAVQYAARAGVTCPVVFNIRDGQYNEADTITAIPGSSAVNTVTLQSESLDSSKVTVYQTDYTPSTSGYIITVDGAKYIRLKALTIKRTPGTFHAFYRVLGLTNDVTGLSISNCDLSSTSAVTLLEYPLAASNIPSNIDILNNNFTGGVAVGLSGYPGLPMNNVNISNNKFRSPQPINNYAQVLLAYMGNTTINNNFFDSSASNATLPGISLQAVTGKVSIIGNRIIKRKGSYGIYLQSVAAIQHPDSAVVIANNFVTMDSIGSAAAIYCTGMSRNTKVVYNNLLNNCFNAGSANSYALFLSSSFSAGTLKDTVANNNIVVTGTGYGIYHGYGSAGDQVWTNNNIWLSSGTKYGQVNGSGYTSLAAIATATGTHTATVSMNPAYVSNTDLHITEINLRTLGKPNWYILNDIDGEVRGTTTSTIGADELIIANTDAGITALVSPVKPFAAGNQTVGVTIKNFGNNALTSAVINWSVNGVMQTPYNYSGNIAFNTTATANIGTVNFVTDSAFAIKAWTTMPNNSTDLNNSNDTITAGNIYPALNGIYTLGGITPDFKGFARSYNNLKYGGMLGNTTFNVRDGKYNEALAIDSIGFQNNYSVTWQGESADSSKATLAYSTIAGDNITAVVQLSNTRNINFKNIGIQVKIPLTNASTNYISMVYMLKANRNIKFQSVAFTDSTYNIIAASNTNGSRFFYNFDASSSGSSNSVRSADSAMVIDNSLFRQTNLSTNPVIDLGGPSTSDFQGNLTSVKYFNNFIFTNNKFNMQLFSKPGVTIGYTDSLRMIGNRLSGNVTVFGKDLMIVDKNDIYHEGNGAKVLTVTSSAGRAIGKPAIISNNTIQSKIVGNFNGYPVPNAVVSITGDRVNLFHNTMAANDTGYISGYGQSAVLNISGANDTVRNNILYNVNGGYLLFHGAQTGMVSNNNDYVYSAHFASGAANLAAWRALTAQDAQSVENINPYFRGPKDLHATNILLKIAPAISPANAYSSTDIDSQMRVAPACLGADEFTQPLNDMIVLDATPKRVFAEGQNTFSIRVYNNGVNPITTFNTTASLTNYVDNFNTPSTAGSLNYTYNGNIASGTEATITLGQMNVPLFRNILKVNTTNLNGVGDEAAFDDSLQYDNYYAGLNGNYTFRDYPNNTPATFKTFNDVVLQLKLGGVYGVSALNMLPGLYTQNMYIDSIPNRGAMSPLSIQSANGDSSTTGFNISSTYPLVIYRANYVTIKGLYFGQPFADTYNSLTLGYNSQNMTVQNCWFKRLGFTGNISTPNNNLLNLIGQYTGQNGYTDSNHVIKNNRFEGGYAGIYTTGGGNTSNANMRITNNSFINQGGYAIATVNLKRPLIDSNVITTNTTDPTYIGISSESNFGKMQYTKNRIFIQTDGTGIKTLESYAPAYALTDTLLIANNFITAGATAASINMSLSVTHRKQTSIYHNSMLNRSTNTGAISLKTQSVNNFGGRFEILNNILFNRTAGLALSVSKDANGAYVQHNENLFTAGATLANVNGTNYANLASLSASTGIEYSSVSGDPLFISDNDLHVDGSIVNNTGSYDSYTVINTDIDGDTRSNNMPDIGADEFTLPNFGAVQLETPLSSCSHSSTETVKAWIKNFGSTARTNIPVAYRINVGTIIRDTVRVSINPGDSVLFTFTQTANLAAPLDYYFDVFTNYRGDSLPANDTLKQFLVATTPANSILPYYTGFEGTNAGWYTGGQNTSFKWGVIFSGIIDSAANGLNAWKTNLTGPHNNNEKSYLYSPCFNLSSVTSDPTLNFNLAFQLETANDKAWVEYSSDAGATWTKLGAQGDGMGWYNDAGNYWTGDHHFWHNAKHVLPVMALADRTSFRVRFVMQTNGSVVQDGLAIDDISIYTGVNPPVAAGTYQNLTAQSTGTGNFFRVTTPGGNTVIEMNDNTQNLGTISVDVNTNAANVPTIYNGQSYLGRSFVIHTQNPPTAPVTVRLYFTQAEFDAWQAVTPQLHQVRDVEVFKFSGANEDNSLGNNTTGTPLTIASSQITKIPYLDGYFLEFNVNNFSEFWITFKGVAVVPVKFVDIKAKLQNNNDALVTWKIASEVNVNRYEVMRSTNGSTWVMAGVTNPITANTQAETIYNFTDRNINDGTNYYQIREVDNNGRITVSNIVSVTKGKAVEVTVYPSPFVSAFTVKNGSDKSALLTLYTADGKTVMSKKVSAGKNTIDGASLAKGIYLYKISGGDGTVFVTGKIVKE